MKQLQSYTHNPASGKDPEQLVILLHGLGANGQDLLSLAPFFSQAMPDAMFVSPDAPFPCDMAPFGYQWFSLQDRTPEKVLAGIQEAAPILHTFIEEQMAAYDMSAAKTALLGFSQGTMMSLYVAPRFKYLLGGVLGYSGALVWEKEANPGDLQKPPVHLIHGAADDVVPVERYHNAVKVLEAAGFDLSGSVTDGLMHNIDEAGIRDGIAFLQRTLC